MNHTQTAAASLLDLANALHLQQVKPAADAYFAALKRLRDVDYAHDRPLDPALSMACELFLAAEALESAADHAMKAIREKIAETMASSGCPGIYTSGHHVTPTEPSRTVLITDTAALALAHPQLMTTPAPAPDKKAIAWELKNGHAVAGASLSNGGATGVRFSPLKQKVA